MTQRRHLWLVSTHREKERSPWPAATTRGAALVGTDGRRVEQTSEHTTAERRCRQVLARVRIHLVLQRNELPILFGTAMPDLQHGRPAVRQCVLPGRVGAVGDVRRGYRSHCGWRRQERRTPNTFE